jgi:mRNA capping enzyme, beta chain
MEIPEGFQSCIDTVTKWMSVACDTENSEIEGRIGFLMPTEEQSRTSFFDGKIDSGAFLTLLGRCYDPEGDWDKHEKETTETYLFEDNIRGTKYGNHMAKFVKKITKSHIDIAIGTTEHVTRKPCIRLSHSLEIETPPPCAQPFWVRIRYRHSFFKGNWRIDLTYVKEGNTRQKALDAPMQHEIEMEMVHRGDASIPQLCAEMLLNLEVMLSDCLLQYPDYCRIVPPTEDVKLKIMQTLYL